jgi:hypothetical protein
MKPVLREVRKEIAKADALFLLWRQTGDAAIQGEFYDAEEYAKKLALMYCRKPQEKP